MYDTRAPFPHVGHRRPTAGRRGARRGGFTLIAITLILMVAAVTITALLPDEGEVSSARLTLTKKRMDDIQIALQNYAMAKGNFVPCPARIDRSYAATEFQQSVTDCDKVMAGSSSSPTQCDTSDPSFRNYQGVLCNPGVSVVAGGVPVGALNLSSEHMIDGWGNKIIYIVDSAATRLSGTLPATYSSPFQIYGISSTDPRDPRGKLLANLASQKPLALLLSTGENANGAYGSNGVSRACKQSSYDGQNCDFSSDMLQYVADRFRNEDGVFDDILQPVILESRSCQEPVPCQMEKCTAPNNCPSVDNPVTATDAQRGADARKSNVPLGCIPSSVVARATGWPMGAGDNTHDSSRIPKSGPTIRCCNGAWTTSGGC